MQIQIASDYPRDSHIQIKVTPSKATTFPLRLRIPYWSSKTMLKVNGATVDEVHSGTYLTLNREWKPGDTIDLDLDFSLHYWVGERECAGKVSIYRGPILLTYDRRLNIMDPSDVPALDARGLAGTPAKTRSRHPPILALDVPAENGSTLTLCDFASAGDGGSHYLSWLHVNNVTATPFSRENPLRSSAIPGLFK